MLIRVIATLLLSITALLLPCSQLHAVGVGVIPSSLELEASPLGSTTSPVNVLNSSDEEALYQVYIEGDFNSWFSISPSEFTLGPHESQEVLITLSPPITATGEHDVSICIVALASASELKIGCGVKIPTHVKIIAPPPLSVIGVNVTGPPLLGMVGAILIGITTGIILRRRRRSREF
ncbi:hypothetical protein ACFLUH_02790 [Chloroflexota bacterium]